MKIHLCSQWPEALGHCSLQSTECTALLKKLFSYVFIEEQKSGQVNSPFILVCLIILLNILPSLHRQTRIMNVRNQIRCLNLAYKEKNNQPGHMLKYFLTFIVQQRQISHARPTCLLCSFTVKALNCLFLVQ